MKKSILVFSCIILILAVSYSFAVEVSLLGPNQYSSHPQKRELCTVYKDSFPGQTGQGTLIFNNGNLDGRNRVIFAAVKINGVNILKRYPLTFLVKGLQLPVTLASSNSLEIDLIGFSGSSVTVEIKEEIAAEAAGAIGASGGNISVTDQNSPIFGYSLDIPAGALTSPVVISIGNKPGVNIPFDSTKEERIDLPAFEILPDNVSLNSPVTISVPYIDNDNDGIFDGTHVPVISTKIYFMREGDSELFAAPTLTYPRSRYHL